MCEVYRRLVDLLSEACFVLDAQGTIIFVNRAHEELVREPPGTLTGLNVRDLIRQKKVNSLVFDVVRKTLKPTQTKGLYINNQDEAFDLVIEESPVIKDGELRYIVGVIREVVPISVQNTDVQTRVGQCRPIIYQSERFRRVLDQLKTIAPLDVTVLLTGETGTGKDVLADLIHQKSKRREGPMIRVNCASIPENLLESELFGYGGGAFTGANREGKEGLIQAADGGTLFLDEINSIPMAMQGKLLYTLESRMVRRVGSTEERPVDFRLISASNESLQSCISQGRFRSDLYFRLSTYLVEVPALRSRRQDILPLAEYFVQTSNELYQKEFQMSPMIRRTLLQYDWPGNVRELKNVVERMVLLDGDIGELQAERDAGAGERRERAYDMWKGATLKEELTLAERAILQEAVRKTGTLTEAARALDIDLATLSRKIQRYGLNR